MEMLGLAAHARSLKSARSEGAASYYTQTTRFGNSYWLRNSLLLCSLLLATTMLVSTPTHASGFVLLALLSLGVFILSRALFYVVVVPTTIPGAFFWKNRGFVEHARETGLADRPQLGVAYEQHHAFRLGDLIHTIRGTSMQQKAAQFRRIFIG